MTDNTYNGWSSYATWRVNLEVVDDYLNSIVSDAHHGYVERYASVYELAEHIKTYVDDVLTDWESAPDSLALDYARAFVSDVDWYEIASHWTDELVTPETVYCQECGEAEVDPESKYGNCTDCMEKYDHLAEVPV